MIPYGRHALDEDDVRAVAEVLRGELLTQGPKAAEFERLVADYVGARYAVSVANGTAALHLACLAAGLGEGDTVVTSANTFLASANCALYVGARPAFSDIDGETLNLDPQVLEDAFRQRTAIKAVIPVHFAGLPCDMPTIRDLAQRHGAIVIEDACHALGGTYADGSRVGNCRYADMTVFSFHPVKVVAAGEGGLITTNDERLYRSLLRLRNHGMTKAEADFTDRTQAYTAGAVNPWYYEMQALGYNYRMTDIQCALAISQFGKLERFLNRRREIANRYDAELPALPRITLPQRGQRARSGNHLYVTRIDFERLGMTRGDVMLSLRARGIGSQVHYIPVPYQPYYRARGLSDGAWPQTDHYYRQALTIPLYAAMTDDDVSAVIGALGEVLSHERRATRS
ncbi:MAG TPA: UDP-4-amino-4,6-dideoxy-N-acetyl-beta-L-altrosamine transaminase [Burkholderiales bacterium]|nr:UDP-4-amino-4,6-dideoxy-N-acetyl-beta-L-altrosamine transaminase [Burkholderiales bacterium]